MSTAKVIGSAPFLKVKNIHIALDYYCDVLGFSRPQIWGDDADFAMPQRDGFIVMLSRSEEETTHQTKHDDDTWDAYFWVDDAETLFESFKGRGAIIEYGPCVQIYEMKEFAVRDKDGHILAFGQHWPQ